MDSAIRAYELLVTESISRAGLLAQELENQNSERQKATKIAQEKAAILIESQGLNNIITTFDPEFGQGIVGLVAAKLTEQYYRPSIVGYQEAEFTRASCRSISEFHITRALDECADLLVRHGGHSMAAGFTIENKNIPRFIERINVIADRELSGRELRQTLKADLEIQISEVKPTIYQDIEKLQPTGMSNPSAMFVSRRVKFSDMRLMGKEGIHTRIVIQGCPINQAVGFHLAEWMKIWRESNPFFDIAYSIEINRYFEKESQQINIRDIRLSTD
jgi:single-stranded-DNA-specific exonuclease